MSGCHDMKKGEIYVCEGSLLQLSVSGGLYTFHSNPRSKSSVAV